MVQNELVQKNDAGENCPHSPAEKVTRPFGEGLAGLKKIVEEWKDRLIASSYDCYCKDEVCKKDKEQEKLIDEFYEELKRFCEKEGFEYDFNSDGYTPWSGMGFSHSEWDLDFIVQDKETLEEKYEVVIEGESGYVAPPACLPEDSHHYSKIKNVEVIEVE